MMTPDTKLPPDLSLPLWRAAGIVVIFMACLAIWAVYAPLATTIRLTGTVVSSTASVDIQHPYGGQVARVLVATHDPVRAGAPLIQLDDTLERGDLSTHQTTQAVLRAENQVISALLTHRLDTLSDQAKADHRHLILRAQQADLQSRLQQDAAANLVTQADTMAFKSQQHQAQITQLENRADRHSNLVTQGVISRENQEALAERIMVVSAELAAADAQVLALKDQRIQQEKRSELTLLALQEELLSRRDRNKAQLRELSLNIAHLSDVISKSTIRSPMDAVVTDLPFQAAGMYAGRGQTLVTLAQPLQAPYVRFRVPPHLIDQLRAGMSGKFTVTGLNQRNLPRLDLTITAISLRTQQNEQDGSQSYFGRARISPEALEALNAALDEGFSLSEDMPVEVMIEGRKTTAARYFLDPLRAAFDHALQD